MDVRTFAFISAGLFTLIATLMTLYQVYRHLQYYQQPEKQRLVVRILLMVPVHPPSALPPPLVLPR